MIEFKVPGKPRGKARPRMCKNGHVYTPRETVDYENAIKAMCAMGVQKAAREAISGDVTMTIIASYAIPKSASRRQREDMLSGLIRPNIKPDADNIVKAVADACNGIAYADDKQIVQVHAFKRYAQEPGLSVYIDELKRSRDEAAGAGMEERDDGL